MKILEQTFFYLRLNFEKTINIFIETIFAFIFLNLIQGYIVNFIPVKYIPNFVQLFAFVYFLDYIAMYLARIFSLFNLNRKAQQ